MNTPSPSPTRRPRVAFLRSGFTLVEMLVSVALVSLMMVLFAEIFTIAGASVGTQKGIARNDQRARVVLNILRNDLLSRTFRSLVPFSPREVPPVIGTNGIDVDEFEILDFAKRRGFFYISENDPNDHTDDVLQFTVEFKAGDDDVFGNSFFGRASSGNGTLDNTKPPRNIPEYDDGEDGNASGASRYAVVSYFLRYGVLYRRVQLLRTPLDSEDDLNPSFATPPANLWRNLDYAVSNDGSGAGLEWHGVNETDNWLDNTLGLDIIVLPGAKVDLIPVEADIRQRFGHDIETGNPREYDSSGNFFGRLTLQETSSDAFPYPNAKNAQYPFASTFPLTVGSNGVVQEYAGSPAYRRGEDILMQNVHEFDIKVFDDGRAPIPGDTGQSPQFVDIGTGNGDFRANRNRNREYGPRNRTEAQRNVYDTWHHRLLGLFPPNDDPPYRPADNYGVGLVETVTTADDSNLRPLRAIQIRLRFFDPPSGQMRQMTIRQALRGGD